LKATDARGFKLERFEAMGLLQKIWEKAPRPT